MICAVCNFLILNFFTIMNNKLIYDIIFSVFLYFTESLRDYFSKFGEITEVMVMKDPTTRRSRYVDFFS